MGNNVFSFAIPTPSHRQGLHGICIESYYTDQELRTEDQFGRRLFLSAEFNPSSGRHVSNPNLSVGNKGKLQPVGKDIFRLIDSEVYDEQNQNVALSKSDFAAHVSAAVEKFGEVNFDQFRHIETVIFLLVALPHSWPLSKAWSHGGN